MSASPPEELGTLPRAGPLAGVWELLFPFKCLGCQRRGVVLCTDCRPAVTWLPTAICPRCATPTVGGRACRACERKAGRHLASARAACTYDGIVRTAVMAVKFRHARSLAPFLAQVLTHCLAQRPIEADLVLPVPLSPRRRRERGFNQSELIAKELARRTDLPPPTIDVLARARDTRPQVGLSAAERQANVRGAFACRRADLVAGRRILLLDDVMTTGATLEASAEPLVQAGAARVMGLVVARDIDRRP